MSTAATFADSLERANVAVTRTSAETFADDVRSAADDPAVGATLPFAEISLPDWVTVDPTPAELEAAASGVTAARLGIADYGSIVIESTPAGDEAVSLYPETHVVIVRASDVVPDMPTAFDRLGDAILDGRGDHVIATGPSATADMGDLVLGAHGPRAVHALLLEDR